jgi:hypothetical protein
LDGVPFRIDLMRCHEAAQMLSNYRPKAIVEPWTSEPIIDQLVFKTLFISICHQMNWDVLQSALARWMLPSAATRLGEFAQTKAADISRILKDYPKQERVRAAERSAMLRDTAQALAQLLEPNGALHKLIASPMLEGGDGFYAVMKAIPAYTGDPLDKKARVLAHDLFRENILKFADPGNLRPAVEYHIIRFYLRSGRVYPVNESVRQELIDPSLPARPRLVKMLRETVDEAMRQTAHYSGLDIATLNYVEWQLGRSVCVAALSPALEGTLCTRPVIDDVPEDIRLLVPTGCPLAGECRSLNDPKYGWYHEPKFQKIIY